MRWVTAIIISLGGCGFAGGSGTSSDVDAPADPEADAPVDASPLVCPTAAGWISISGSASKYKVESNSDEISPWWRANMRCNDVGAGVHLVVLDSPQEAMDLSVALAASKIYFIGMVQPNGLNLPSSGWKQITGGDGISHWGINEPNDGKPPGNILETGAEQFAVIDQSSNLRDEDGDRSHYYVCECDGKALDASIQIPPR